MPRGSCEGSPSSVCTTRVPQTGRPQTAAPSCVPRPGPARRCDRADSTGEHSCSSYTHDWKRLKILTETWHLVQLSGKSGGAKGVLYFCWGSFKINTFNDFNKDQSIKTRVPTYWVFDVKGNEVLTMIQQTVFMDFFVQFRTENSVNRIFSKRQALLRTSGKYELWLPLIYYYKLLSFCPKPNCCLWLKQIGTNLKTRFPQLLRTHTTKQRKERIRVEYNVAWPRHALSSVYMFDAAL